MSQDDQPGPDQKRKGLAVVAVVIIIIAVVILIGYNIFYVARF